MNVEGSVDGLYFNQDRVTVVQGRMADPKRANEVMMTVGAADSLGLRVGQTVTWGTYSNAQFESTASAPPSPALHERLTLVATVALNNAVVQDEIDAGGPTTVILTPALTRRLVNCCANYSFTYLQLNRGSRDVPEVEAEIESVIPSKLPYDFYDTSIDVTKAQNAIKPEAIALGVFGLIAGLAASYRGSGDRSPVGFLGSGRAHSPRPRRRPRHDRGRRAARGHARRHGGRAPGRGRGGGALPTGTAGPGTSGTIPTPESPSTGRYSASVWRCSSWCWAPWRSCSPCSGRRSGPRRVAVRERPRVVKASRPRAACPCRRLLASASRWSRGRRTKPCRCARRSSVPPWPWWSSSPPWSSAPASAPWCRTPASTAGTGTMR